MIVKTGCETDGLFYSTSQNVMYLEISLCPLYFSMMTSVHW